MNGSDDSTSGFEFSRLSVSLVETIYLRLLRGRGLLHYIAWHSM